jgi:UDP-N-acetyl-2-amino-2-deoxyglucuronate dehydrogenase
VTAPTFALIGAAGFVAPRHVDAIHANGGRLVAACDPHDSVGVLDRYGEAVKFINGDYGGCSIPRTDYVAICTPNDSHASFSRAAMQDGADVICEKPLATSVRSIDNLLRFQTDYGRRVWPILQMRLNPAILAWRERRLPGRFRVHLDYVTPRGPWYWASWKGDEARSGGLATNIGVHLFDVLLWLFGEAQFSDVTYRDRPQNPKAMAGRLVLERADVTWSLSTLGAKPSRILWIDDDVLDLSEGFTSLHTAVYREILAGRWYGLADARPAIALCETLRTLAPGAAPR